MAFLTSCLHAGIVSLYSSWVLASTLCMFPFFCLFGQEHLVQLLRPPYFFSDTLLNGMDQFWKRWSLNQISWAPLPSRALLHGDSSKQILKEAKVCSSEVQFYDLVFSLLPFSVLNFSILWSLQPRLPLTFISPVILSLLLSMMSSRAFLLSVTRVRKLSMLCRNLLHCLCPAMILLLLLLFCFVLLIWIKEMSKWWFY